MVDGGNQDGYESGGSAEADSDVLASMFGSSKDVGSSHNDEGGANALQVAP